MPELTRRDLPEVPKCLNQQCIPSIFVPRQACRLRLKSPSESKPSRIRIECGLSNTPASGTIAVQLYPTNLGPRSFRRAVHRGGPDHPCISWSDTRPWRGPREFGIGAVMASETTPGPNPFHLPKIADLRVRLAEVVPVELRARLQWVGWRLALARRKQVTRQNSSTTVPNARRKYTKMPVNPHTGELAETDNPKTWGTLEQALEAAEKFHLSGVGYSSATMMRSPGSIWTIAATPKPARFSRGQLRSSAN